MKSSYRQTLQILEWETWLLGQVPVYYTDGHEESLWPQLEFEVELSNPRHQHRSLLLLNVWLSRSTHEVSRQSMTLLLLQQERSDLGRMFSNSLHIPQVQQITNFQVALQSFPTIIPPLLRQFRDRQRDFFCLLRGVRSRCGHGERILSSWLLGLILMALLVT